MTHALFFLRWVSVLAVFWLLSPGLTHAQDGQGNLRVALVIGNSAYQSAPLVNPRNDANAMAQLLTKAGFQVDMQLDADLGKMQAAVDRFGQVIKDPKVKFGLFYYAGHGLQQDWRNYLVPVTAAIRKAADVPQQTVDVSSLLRYMEQAKGRSFLVVLDACRNDPFAGAFRPAAKGLSQFDAPVGSLLAYATSPGNVAQDGEGENGLYTGFLLREFAVPGARLEDAFKRVRVSVRVASNGEQIPWESTSLEEDLYLFPIIRPQLTEAERDQLLDREISSWLRVKSSTDPKALAEFIREFPSGSASELAQSRLSRVLKASADEKALRDQAKIQKAAQEASELAAREEQARREAALAEEKRVLAQRAEEERVQLAKQEAAREEARKQQIAAQAATAAAAARLAQEKALAAEQETQRLAASKTQAEQARAQQARLQEQQQREAARVSQLAAQAAAEQLRQAQATQADKERQERELAAHAESARVATAVVVEQQRKQAELLAAQKQTLLAVASVVPSVASLSPTPYFKGYHEHQRHFTVGDEAHFQIIDMYTKATKPLTMKVTQVDLAAERVSFNDGQFESDLMGNTTRNVNLNTGGIVGVFDTPRQFYPADLMVGKKWQTRFKQSRPSGITYTYQYDLKVVAKETVTVPAGTFEAYKIEARGFNMELGARLERNIWVAPGVNADIAHEIVVRLRSGRVEQADRQELVSFAQARR